jgi:A/G-specific adenine glycosylase
MPEVFSIRLLNWYAEHARQLPWRGDPDPYKVWISEMMLQQTRVGTVIPYYLRWIERFPSIPALAAASEQDVLSAWEGLGYYSRARNLHRAAQVMMEKYSGQLPDDVQELQRLPGIGRYTAAAIASIAFGRDEPALDGNIRRVLSRLFDVSLPARSPAGEKRLWELAGAHLPPGRAGDYNQALMDLGASICTPRSPACTRCPLAELCQARLLGVQEERPVMEPKPPIPHHTVAAAVIQKEDGPQGVNILLARRPSHGLLGGLWEFPGGKLQDGEDLPACLKREICEELGVDISVGEQFGVYRHAYTHFRLTLHAFLCTLTDGAPQALEASELRWVMPADLGSYPMGKIDRQIASRLVSL